MNGIRWPAYFCMVGILVWILVMMLFMILGVDFELGIIIFFAMTSSFNVVLSSITYNFDEILIKDRRFLSILFMAFAAILFFFCFKLLNGKFNHLYLNALAIFGLINCYGLFYLFGKMEVDDDSDEDFDW